MKTGTMPTKLILFTGAGASSFLGYELMDSFVDLLINEVGGRVSDQRPLYSIKQIDTDQGVLPMDNFLSKIIQEKGKNIENILAELESIINLGNYSDVPTFQDEEAAKARPKGAPPVLGGTGIPEVKKWFSKLKTNAQEIRKITLNLIHDRYDRLDEEQEKYKVLYSELLSLLLELNNNFLPVFTTNYDRSFEKVCKLMEIDIYDGFKNQTWNPENYKSTKGKEKGNRVAYFKLHGSVDWYIDKRTNEIRRGPSISLENKEHYENIIIYPTKNKLPLNEPFSSLYNFFETYLLKTPFCVFIGYSFNDYETLSIIKRARNNNKELTFLIVDINPEKIIKNNLRNIGIEENIIQIKKHFGSQNSDIIQELKKYLV
jgi:hypothetical protein